MVSGRFVDGKGGHPAVHRSSSNLPSTDCPPTSPRQASLPHPTDPAEHRSSSLPHLSPSTHRPRSPHLPCHPQTVLAPPPLPGRGGWWKRGRSGGEDEEDRLPGLLLNTLKACRGRFVMGVSGPATGLTKALKRTGRASCGVDEDGGSEDVQEGRLKRNGSRSSWLV